MTRGTCGCFAEARGLRCSRMSHVSVTSTALPARREGVTGGAARVATGAPSEPTPDADAALVSRRPVDNVAAVPARPLSGWGRHPWIDTRLRPSQDLLNASRDAVLFRGLGRAYGDAALPVQGEAGLVTATPPADRVLAFDPDAGVLRAEAGLSLGGIRQLFLPLGFMSPVRTGTRHVTLGGMVAADVHGKEHHVAGCFGAHVRELLMRTGDGELRRVSRTSHADLFAATLGGMGLTGHVLEVEVELERVPSPWIYSESERFHDLASVVDGLAEASADWPMTVAWIDTSVSGPRAGRGMVMRGRWAAADEAPSTQPLPHRSIAVPFTLPSGLVNGATIRLANAALWYKHGSSIKRGVGHPDPWFWPLDRLEQWNRGYGNRGFTQYQCVMPRSVELFREFLLRFQRGGGCSFVTVLKDCGPASEGLLSFPQAGTSLALDIPISPNVPALVRELNAMVIANGGRVYLAKDAFTTPEEFRAMYPRFDDWCVVRDRYDPQRRLRSAMSRRLFGD
ncbi:MAG: FAD-binding oxidoreductase [Myxococcales bacterium FL481]|nr:MAG: FAD-binding oxidoreductase [Myxococcales bacterium FL481]